MGRHLHGGRHSTVTIQSIALDLSWPVVSVSLGDEGLFRVGQTTRGGATQSVWLQSGDVAVLSGEARLAYHGIDRTKFRSSKLLPDGGRINITLRIAGH